MYFDCEVSRLNVLFTRNGREPKPPEIPEQPWTSLIENGVKELLCKTLVLGVGCGRSSWLVLFGHRENELRHSRAKIQCLLRFIIGQRRVDSSSAAR